MRIELDNKTHWRSDHIRAFVAYSLKDERPDLCKRGAPALRVRVVYTRTRNNSSSSGFAYYNSNFICVRLSRYAPDKVDFAFVITHELAHTRGMHHPAMRGNPHYRRVGSNRSIYAWGNDLPLETVGNKKVAPPPPPRALPKQKSLEEFVEAFGFRVEEYGGNEYEVFAKDGYNMGDGAHSRICHSIRDVKETVDAYQFMIEPCPDDCDCRD